MDNSKKIITDLGDEVLVFSETTKNTETGKIEAGGWPRALLMDIDLDSDGDYRVDNAEKLGIKYNDDGHWVGKVIFLHDYEMGLREMAQLYLGRLIGSLDGSEDWRLYGTVRDIMQGEAMLHPGSMWPIVWPPVEDNLKAGQVFEIDISDGNQGGCIKIKYISNKFTDVFNANDN